jgi:putative oxidoreductase
MSKNSSHPLLSYADGIATGMTDTLLLVGRVLIAAVFLMTVWFGSPTAAYLTSLNYVNPEMLSLLARTVEWIIGISLVFGIGTRYGTLLGLAFVIVATVTAHRYWGYPQAAQLVQYTFLSKNIAIAGGAVVLFVTGGGRFSVDGIWASKS